MLVRQNTFTKGESPTPRPRPGTTQESGARLVTGGDTVRLVGGKIVREQQQAVMVAGETGDRPKLVRRKTWTKQEGEMLFKTQQQADFQSSGQARGERYETRKTSDNLKLEGQLEVGSRREEVVGIGERATVTRQQDNLRLEGEMVGKVPDKWEPGERAAVVKHADNLQPPGPVEDTRDKAPLGAGERAPRVRPGDNLQLEQGEFMQRQVEEYNASQRTQVVKHSDQLRLEGEMTGSRKEWAVGAGERAQVVRHSDNLRSEGEFELPEHQAWAPGERSAVVRRQDNLKLAGEFQVRECKLNF